jgi:hypothetical protein
MEDCKKQMHLSGAQTQVNFTEGLLEVSGNPEEEKNACETQSQGQLSSVASQGEPSQSADTTLSSTTAKN